MLSKHTKAKYYTCLSDTGKKKESFLRNRRKRQKVIPLELIPLICVNCYPFSTYLYRKSTIFAFQITMGLTGFDSGQKWYVSMQCVDDWHLNPSCQRIIWRKQLRSRCVIEVQQITFILSQGERTGHHSEAVVPKRSGPVVQPNRKQFGSFLAALAKSLEDKVQVGGFGLA